jgi:hypothetical protein
VLWNLLHNLIDMLNYLMHNVCILNQCHIDCHFMSLDTSRVKARMMYSSSKNRFQRELDGIHYELQATDASQVDIDVISNCAY